MKMGFQGIRFGSPLTDDELDAAESRYQLVFPKELRAFYKQVMPIGNSFPNWRSKHSRDMVQIRRMLDWPLEGILFDVKENEFWLPGWGDRPKESLEAERICSEMYMNAPQLIPIYGHRYLPAEPGEGSPVLSVYQTDIIYYGANLMEYFEVEFGSRTYEQISWDRIKAPRFWDEIIDSYQ
ncbi:SMI1/KNR4 family protein [Neobacillus mesonae]|nr:SMI1/KNR4 family protein [Neobacillus mesonae]